jgi:integrase
VPILTRRLQAIIDKQRLTILGERKTPDAFVFDADGLGLRKADVGDTWRVVRRQLNIDHVRWHDLRGTFLSRLLAIGVPNARVAQLAGHASLRMMDVYNRQPGITAEHIAEFKILFASLLPREASAPRRRAAA